VSISIGSVEHAIAIAAQKLVAEAKLVTQTIVPVLRRAQASEATIESVTALVNPNAVVVERAAFAVLGKILAAMQDGQAAVQASGLNIQLDAQELADLKALAATLKPSVAPVS